MILEPLKDAAGFFALGALAGFVLGFVVGYASFEGRYPWEK